MSFKNKVVLITGAGSGMGEAAAILFAKEGADIVIVDRNETTANNTAKTCKQFGIRTLVIQADITKAEDVNNIVEKTIKEFEKLNVLVNNAGIVKPGLLMSGDIMNTFDEVLNTNLRAVVHMTNVFTPYLIKTKGCIVNTSSVVTKAPRKGCVYPAYVISKCGVDSFTRLAALELAPSGVRVNAVNPGPVLTNLLENNGIENMKLEVLGFEETPFKRCSDPSEIAELIIFLASDKAKSITGSTYVIDNGMALV